MPCQTERPLTNYTALGGCSCKLAPGPLAHLLGPLHSLENEVTGTQGDDAAIISLGHGYALVQSVDFQSPIVDDPEIAGYIAAANALSDLFACGAQPQWAEVILALPNSGEAIEVGQRILAGVQRACKASSCKIVGGHTILAPAPLIGLTVSGIGFEARLKRKEDLWLNDRLLLTKPIGGGIAIAARQMGLYTDAVYHTALESMQSINMAGIYLGSNPDVHAMTDVTGFGLAGHLCEMAIQSHAHAQIDFSKIPKLPRIVAAARDGALPLLAEGTLKAFQDNLFFDGSWESTDKLLCCAPETNGGLLIAVAPSAVAGVQENLRVKFGIQAEAIGSVTAQSLTERGHVTFIKE